MSDQILEGCRVLDLSNEKGQFCGKILADMGAEVILLRKPGAGICEGYLNTGKHSLSLNLDTKTGQDLLKRIVHSAGILIESFQPGYLSSLDLSFDDLRKLNPGLIMASITHFGQKGPWKDYVSSDLVDSALGGSLAVGGEPDKSPLKPFGAQAHLTACLFAANAIMLGLRQRHFSGRGQHIDISIHECQAATLDHTLVRYFYEGVTAGRTGQVYWNKAFGIFPCKDGRILLSLTYQWETLVEWLASENAAEDLTGEQWLDETERQKHLDHIMAVLEKWTQKHEMDELVESGQQMHFPWARVNSVPEVINNPQLKVRGYFVDTKDPASGMLYKFPGAPVKMSSSPWGVQPQNPLPGGYNHKIYREELGLDGAELAELKRQGVV